jgi:glycerophosphoryl diester phosphodiesterase
VLRVNVRRAVGGLAMALVLVAGCGDDGGDSEAEATTTTTAVPTEPPAAFGQESVIVGHRGGANDEFPDNSLEAIAGARERGATWVEIDVRLSADGTAVLSHDPETEAGTEVATATAEELAAEDIPTLLEALDVIDEHALGVDVEIKADPAEPHAGPLLSVVEETMANLVARPPNGPVVVTSFNRDAIDRVLELTGSDYDTALIAAGIGGAVELAGTLSSDGHDGVVLDFEAADAGTVNTLISAGDLTVWAYTVNDPAVALELAGRGVTGIVTDVPEEMVVTDD